MTILPPMRFTGAKVLRDGALQRGSLAIEAGRIVDACAPEIDLRGYLVLPGIVDMNAGGFARHLSLRPSQTFPLPIALASAAREAAVHGVTTAWMAQGWSWEGGLSSPELAAEMLAELDAIRDRLLIDIRAQLRVETHMTEQRDDLVSAVSTHGVDFVIFTNKLPEAIQMSGRASHKLAAWAEREGRSVEDFIKRLRAAKDRAGEVPRHLLALAESFDKLGVIYGSHDDPDGETREQMRLLGARIAEFPLRAGAAAVARANGDPIILCASDIVHGGARAGAISTMALITKGTGDALASRDHPSCLAEAAFVMSEMGIRSLPEAWAMVSEVPARIMGLNDRGRLAKGLRADLTIVNEASGQVEATIAGGRMAYLGGEAALRFLAARAVVSLAAE